MYPLLPFYLLSVDASFDGGRSHNLNCHVFGSWTFSIIIYLTLLHDQLCTNGMYAITFYASVPYKIILETENLILS